MRVSLSLSLHLIKKVPRYSLLKHSKSVLQLAFEHTVLRLSKILMAMLYQIASLLFDFRFYRISDQLLEDVSLERALSWLVIEHVAWRLFARVVINFTLHKGHYIIYLLYGRN